MWQKIFSHLKTTLKWKKDAETSLNLRLGNYSLRKKQEKENISLSPSFLREHECLYTRHLELERPISDLDLQQLFQALINLTKDGRKTNLIEFYTSTERWVLRLLRSDSPSLPEVPSPELPSFASTSVKITFPPTSQTRVSSKDYLTSLQTTIPSYLTIGAPLEDPLKKNRMTPTSGGASTRLILRCLQGGKQQS